MKMRDTINQELVYTISRKRFWDLFPLCLVFFFTGSELELECYQRNLNAQLASRIAKQFKT